MQGELIESSVIRKSKWDGPFAMTSQNLAIAGAYTVPGGAGGQSPPYMIVLNPGATTQVVTMYPPSPATVMWCHEIWNSSVGAGALTLHGVAGATIGSVAPGKRAEVVWNIYASPAEWVAFLSA
jgi:hypothetical protein